MDTGYLGLTVQEGLINLKWELGATKKPAKKGLKTEHRWTVLLEQRSREQARAGVK